MVVTSMRICMDLPHHYEVDLPDENPSSGVAHRFPGLAGRPADGLLVKVVPHRSAPWTGLFPQGTLAHKAVTGIFSCPEPSVVCVVVAGRGYMVEVTDPTGFELVSLEPIVDVQQLPGSCLLVLATPWALCAFGPQGLVWTTGRLSVEGLRIVGVVGGALRVETDPGTDESQHLAVNMQTGQVISQ